MIRGRLISRKKGLLCLHQIKQVPALEQASLFLMSIWLDLQTFFFLVEPAGGFPLHAK